MKNLVIRRAVPEETEALLNFCRSQNPEDYLPNILPDWLRDTNAVNLIAVTQDCIAGFVFGKMFSGTDGWAQALRVHQGRRNQHIGTRLMTSLEKELYKRGARTIYANIGFSSKASLNLVMKLNWDIAGDILRRSIRPDKSLSSTPVIQSIPISIKKLINAKKLLASQERIAFFKRVYFSMSDDFINRCIELDCVIVSTSLNSVALLDPETEKLWVIALAGEGEGL